ncbi:hypothetical protein EPUL_001911, partial [Erysiphe pulchra]
MSHSLSYVLQLTSFLNFVYIIAILQYTAYAAFDIHENSEQLENGFSCGGVLFTENKVQEVLNVATSSVGKDNLRPYVGGLYGYMANYFRLPIFQYKSYLGKKQVPKEEIWFDSTYQVVMDSRGGFIDVIFKIKVDDYAKCLRISDFRIVNDNDQSVGYQCGEKFISSVELLLSTEYARKQMGKGFSYPALYKGHLYGEELGLVMWPIYKGAALHRSPFGPGGPYFILLDPMGQVIDVIVHTFEDGYIRCFKSRNILSASLTNVEHNSMTQLPKSGFTCYHVFFRDSELENARKLAKLSRSANKLKIFPLKYSGHPFHSPCLLWPIKASGRPYTRGKLPPYRLVLTLDYEVFDVIMQSGDVIKRCRRTTAGGFSDFDKNNYDCDGTIFYHDELVSVAKVACGKKNVHGLKFPQKYDVEEFEIEGPYFVYPILKGIKFKFMSLVAGPHRMVMNSHCVVVGALTMDGATGNLRKCE